MDFIVIRSAFFIDFRPGSPVPRGVRVRVRNINARARAYRDAGRPYPMYISFNPWSVVFCSGMVSLFSMVDLTINYSFSDLAELCSRGHKC